MSNKKRQKKIGLLQKLQNILPKSALLTIYKCFIRPNLDQLILYYFKNNILQFIRTSPSKIFQCHNPEGIKLVTILRLGLRLSLKNQLQLHVLSNLLFLQSKSCSEEIPTMIPLWFQACIYWKIVCYLIPSTAAVHIFVILSLFHKSTWSHTYAKDTVFVSQHFFQPPTLTSSLWLTIGRAKGLGYIGLRAKKIE